MALAAAASSPAPNPPRTWLPRDRPCLFSPLARNPPAHGPPAPLRSATAVAGRPRSVTGPGCAPCHPVGDAERSAWRRCCRQERHEARADGRGGAGRNPSEHRDDGDRSRSGRPPATSATRSWWSCSPRGCPSPTTPSPSTRPTRPPPTCSAGTTRRQAGPGRRPTPCGSCSRPGRRCPRCSTATSRTGRWTGTAFPRAPRRHLVRGAPQRVQPAHGPRGAAVGHDAHDPAPRRGAVHGPPAARQRWPTTSRACPAASATTSSRSSTSRTTRSRRARPCCGGGTPTSAILSPGPSLARTKWAERLAGVEAWSVLRRVRARSPHGRTQGRSLQAAHQRVAHHLARSPAFLPRVRAGARRARGIDPRHARRRPAALRAREGSGARCAAVAPRPRRPRRGPHRRRRRRCDAPPAALQKACPSSVLKVVVGNAGHLRAIAGRRWLGGRRDRAGPRRSARSAWPSRSRPPPTCRPCWRWASTGRSVTCSAPPSLRRRWCRCSTARIWVSAPGGRRTSREASWVASMASVKECRVTEVDGGTRPLVATADDGCRARRRSPRRNR